MPRKLKKRKTPMSVAKVSLQTKSVENPQWRPDLDGEAAFPRNIDVAHNYNESAVESLYHRKFIGSAQKKAADRFRELWEAAGGKTSGMDYTQDRVDGGKADPVLGRIHAAQELERCRNLLGTRHFSNIEKLCGEGLGLQQLSRNKRDRYTMADNLRADLDELASMWGYYVTAASRARRQPEETVLRQRTYFAGKRARMAPRKA